MGCVCTRDDIWYAWGDMAGGDANDKNNIGVPPTCIIALERDGEGKGDDGVGPFRCNFPSGKRAAMAVDWQSFDFSPAARTTNPPSHPSFRHFQCLRLPPSPIGAVQTVKLEGGGTGEKYCTTGISGTGLNSSQLIPRGGGNMKQMEQRRWNAPATRTHIHVPLNT